MALKDYIQLARPWQWYKNSVVAIGLVFGGLLLDLASVWSIILAFFALCLASSGNYVLNDIIDRKRDCLNPEKSNRPIAKGRVSVGTAVLFLILLWIAAGSIALYLDKFFLVFVIALVACTALYSFFLKKEPIADVVMVAINFLIRAASGDVVLNIPNSPWMINGVFFFALYLSVAKRHSEVSGIKNASNQRKVLSFYTPELTQALMIVSFSLLIASYALASFLGQYNTIIWTLPVVLYAGFRHFMLVLKGEAIGRHAHLAIRDRRFVIAGVLWIALTLFLIYAV